ncbi:MAG: glycosyl hydrolase, partial [Gemmatimonadaceae bacterium]
QRAAMGTSSLLNETLTRVEALQRAIDQTSVADDRLATDARALERRLRDIQMLLSGDATLSRRQEATPPSLLKRLNGITTGLWSNTLDAPTNTQRRQYDIVSAEFEKILAQLRPLVETELRRIEDAAEAAGAPWTTGRIPSWRP